MTTSCSKLNRMPFIDSGDSGVQRCDLEFISAIPDRYFRRGAIPQVAEVIFAPSVCVRTGRDDLGKHCFGFDFDAPLGIEQRGDNHGRCGADLAEDFAVGAADGFPILLVGNEHTGAVHMLELRSCL
jgi:hypothetical protein